MWAYLAPCLNYERVTATRSSAWNAEGGEGMINLKRERPRFLVYCSLAHKKIHERGAHFGSCTTSFSNTWSDGEGRLLQEKAPVSCRPLLGSRLRRMQPLKNRASFEVQGLT